MSIEDFLPNEVDKLKILRDELSAQKKIIDVKKAEGVFYGFPGGLTTGELGNYNLITNKLRAVKLKLLKIKEGT